jgi:hypothetical protein
VWCAGQELRSLLLSSGFLIRVTFVLFVVISVSDGKMLVS